MKSIKVLFALALAASFASAAFAASESTLHLVRVPKTEAAMQATRATTAHDAANNPVKSATQKTKARQGKGASAKKHKPKASAVK